MEAIENSFKFKQWANSLALSGVTLKGVENLVTIHKPNGEALFAMLQIDATTDDGNQLPPVVVLRGHFVAVLTAVVEKETGQTYLLLVKQRRVANGAFFYEHPAGMCDSTADPYEVALKEVKEETSLSIQREQLIRLNDELIYGSPGLLDEGGYFFYCNLTMTQVEINELKTKILGADDEDEQIQLVFVTVSEALKLIKNAHGLLHIYLYLDAIKTL